MHFWEVEQVDLECQVFEERGMLAPRANHASKIGFVDHDFGQQLFRVEALLLILR